jgi:hypothetical protein
MGVAPGKLRGAFNRFGEAFRLLYGPPEVDPRERLPRSVAYPMTGLLFTLAMLPIPFEPLMLLAAPLLLPLTKPLSAALQIAINTVTADVEEKLGVRDDFNAPARRPLPKRGQPRPARDFTIRF